GKPFQLLEPIQVSGELQLAQSDLQASLNSEILTNAFTELLIALLELKGIENPQALLNAYKIEWQGIALAASSFTLTGLLIDTENAIPLKIRADLTLLNAQTLHLQDIELVGLPGVISEGITDFKVDLGTDVEIESLDLNPGELSCVGRLLIRP
ncbi:MAG: LmeA family phospholipid-binding protein, partial [Microcystaceae cyanobacterium]